MSNRLGSTVEQMRSAKSRMSFFSELPNHFSRVFTLFSPAERRKLLHACYRFYLTLVPNRCDLWQFCVFEFVNTLDLENDVLNDIIHLSVLTTWDEDPVSGWWKGDARNVSREDLTPKGLRWLSLVENGESPLALAKLVASSRIMPDMFDQEEFDSLLRESFGHCILTAEQAAAVVACIQANSAQARRSAFDGESRAFDLIQLPDSMFRSVDQKRAARAEADLVLVDSRTLENTIAKCVGIQENLLSSDDLRARYALNSDATLILPPVTEGVRRRIDRAFSTILGRAVRDRKALLDLSPRAFEDFMSGVFRELGFQVELTQQSRDGGVDLLCVRNDYGIPYRMAVELKRYARKAIDVRLVRSFVGSNEQYRANKLLYITTSRYTKDAIAFADKYASHILTLRDYSAIREWCAAIRNGSA